MRRRLYTRKQMAQFSGVSRPELRIWQCKWKRYRGDHRRWKINWSKMPDRELAAMRDCIDAELERRDGLAEEKARERAARTVISIRTAQELVRCGTAGCKCATGKLHGPYWYAYATLGTGRARKIYLGRGTEAQAQRAIGTQLRALSLQSDLRSRPGR
jgi:hypothetical protein